MSWRACLPLYTSLSWGCSEDGDIVRASTPSAVCTLLPSGGITPAGRSWAMMAATHWLFGSALMPSVPCMSPFLFCAPNTRAVDILLQTRLCVLVRRVVPEGVQEWLRGYDPFPKNVPIWHHDMPVFSTLWPHSCRTRRTRTEARSIHSGRSYGL